MDLVLEKMPISRSIQIVNWLTRSSIMNLVLEKSPVSRLKLEH
jgi:hypothetical protein